MYFFFVEKPQKPEKSEVQQNQQQKDEPPALKQSLSPVDEFKAEDLVALTDKEHLKVFTVIPN